MTHNLTQTVTEQQQRYPEKIREKSLGKGRNKEMLQKLSRDLSKEKKIIKKNKERLNTKICLQKTNKK